MIRASRLFALLFAMPFALAIPLLFSAAALASHHEDGEKKPSAGVSMQQMIEEQLGNIPSADEVIAELTANLELSGEQASSIRPIVARMSKQMLALVEKFKAGELQAMGLMMQIQSMGTKAAREIESHLTPDQTKKYGQFRVEQRKTMMKQFMNAQSASRAAK